jgi:hypothetical protein
MSDEPAKIPRPSSRRMTAELEAAVLASLWTSNTAILTSSSCIKHELLQREFE